MTAVEIALFARFLGALVAQHTSFLAFKLKNSGRGI
jgi:hypothetical protein